MADTRANTNIKTGTLKLNEAMNNKKIIIRKIRAASQREPYG